MEEEDFATLQPDSDDAVAWVRYSTGFKAHATHGLIGDYDTSTGGPFGRLGAASGQTGLKSR